MIGVNVFIPEGVASFVNSDILVFLKNVSLQGGKDYDTTYTLHTYVKYNLGLVSTCTQGKEGSLFGIYYQN